MSTIMFEHKTLSLVLECETAERFVWYMINLTRWELGRARIEQTGRTYSFQQ